ncbi:leucine rich repeat domain containing protein [Acanthamoeba castellanii str. Neff]|uniref:Leucine rich repeat domain containing protein n=1 Tax=Acanthamoeba castellanii (strain ATCC 30010 / Neff) TaxID=1257118 RepID=L8GLR4_ACACF|nr:leucine rich repeat domain containing protein [Acanthamoeba castellanii str. Neff]ELR13126.1 leucine rich repeat domain containing protein [Acanthamoeba castellanii str. Neff]
MEGEACSAYALNLCGLGHGFDSFDALEAKLAALGPKERAVLTDLNLSHNNLIALPPSLFHLPHLTRLDLSFNQLPTLPAAVGGLTQLQVLNLLGNPLAALPLEMQGLTELRKLKVSNVTKRKLAANPQLFLRYLKPLPLKPSKL